MKRILFIDDEPRILKGLERSMRKKREVWEMTFLASAPAALLEMERVPFDVVVSDLEMPVLDGVQLLERFRRTHPQCLRIVFSGSSELELALQGAMVSHQYVVKPCAPGELAAIIDRTCHLRELLREIGEHAAIVEIGQLPALPGTYRALLAALSRREVDLAEIAAVVERDVVISAQVIKLANSSLFASHSSILEIREAVVRLGIDVIRSLVLCLEAFREFGDPPAGSGFSAPREQNHALLTARIAQRLTDPGPARVHAFLAALLHDIGKLVLTTRLPDRFPDSPPPRERPPLVEVEERLGTIGHAEVGAHLLESWGMPYPIVEAVGHHHHPSRIPDLEEFGVVGAVHVANALANGDSPDAMPTAGFDEVYLERCGLLHEADRWREVADEEMAAL